METRVYGFDLIDPFSVRSTGRPNRPASLSAWMGFPSLPRPAELGGCRSSLRRHLISQVVSPQQEARPCSGGPRYWGARETQPLLPTHPSLGSSESRRPWQARLGFRPLALAADPTSSVSRGTTLWAEGPTLTQVPLDWSAWGELERRVHCVWQTATGQLPTCCLVKPSTLGLFRGMLVPHCLSLLVPP